jgi:hypothetical protein
MTGDRPGRPHGRAAWRGSIEPQIESVHAASLADSWPAHR